MISLGESDTLQQSNTNETEATPQSERCILVKLLTPGNAAMTDARNPLGELVLLAEAAGAEIVDAMLQKRMTVHPRTHIGKGKVEELVERVAASKAALIIFDDELSPAQIRSLEKATERRVIDRSELILDLFAARASTHEAKLQVEIAQLEYTAPRLRGMWTHLERIAGAGGGGTAGAVGGIGTRGPGERQIEIDRRIVRDRLAYLRREIKSIDKRKTREVTARSDAFTISLVGYTNAGKSTLMNALTDAGQEVKDMLFATLDTKTARWNLGGGRQVLLSDTVGFVRNLPHKLVASFKATLEEAIHADLLFHVVDASARDAMRQVEVVQGVLSELGCADKPMLTVLNKVDVVEDFALLDVLAEKHAPTLRIAARSGRGLELLADAVVERLASTTAKVRLRFPASEGKLTMLLGQYGEVHEQAYRDSSVEVLVTLSRTHLEQLRGRYACLETLEEFSA